MKIMSSMKNERKVKSVASKDQMLSANLCEKKEEEVEEVEEKIDSKVSLSALRRVSSSLGGQGSAKVRLAWTYYSTLSSSSSGGYFEFRPTDDGEWSTWASVFNEFRVDKIALNWNFGVYVMDTNSKRPAMCIAYLPGKDSAPGNWAAMNDLSSSKIIQPSSVKYNFVTTVNKPQMYDGSSAVLYEPEKWLNCTNNAGVYSGRFYLYGSDGLMQSATTQYLYIVGYMWISFRKKK